MADSALRILQVNSVDLGGGAARVAWDLFRGYRRRGHESWLVSGVKLTDDPFVRELDHDPYRRGLPGWLAKVWKPFRKYEAKWPGLRSLHRQTLLGADARRINNRLKGIEDFEFPGTAHLLELIPERPEILHFHNLHGDYFDLRELANLSQQLPVVLTLHDAWLLSGNCYHSFECERWKTGCGNCPDLTIPPPVPRDATAFNWQRKREIFLKSRFYIASPSKWLLQKVEKSILTPSVVETRIIPNGVDQSVFQPGDQRLARQTLGLPQDTKVVLFAGNRAHKRLVTDFPTLRSAIVLIAGHLPGQNMIMIGLGEESPTEHIGKIEIRYVPYQKDLQMVARYYQAADIYVHATRADTFPLRILESLTCGTPVVATAVGGTPEQIAEGENGFLVPIGDAQAMASRIEQILIDDDLHQRMGRAAADNGRPRFDLERTIDGYLVWFERIRKEGLDGKRRK